MIPKREKGLKFLNNLRSHLQKYVIAVQESKQQVLKKYFVGLIAIGFSLILISTANFIVFLPKSYNLNPLLPIQRIRSFSMTQFDLYFWEITRGYGFLGDSMKYHGRILAYQTVIASTIARIYTIANEDTPTKVFKQSYLAFLLILLTVSLIVVGIGNDVFIEGKISWLILFSTALGIFLSFEQLKQQRDPFDV